MFRDPECWCHIAISPAFYPDESFCFVPGSCSLLKTASTKVTWILPRNKKRNPSCYSTGNLVNQEWSRSYSEYIQGLNGGGCSEDSIWFVLPFDLTHFIRRDTLFKRLHLRATQIATLNFWSQEENQIIGPLEGRKDGRYVSPEDCGPRTSIRNSSWRTIWVKREGTCCCFTQNQVFLNHQIKTHLSRTGHLEDIYTNAKKIHSRTKYTKGVFKSQVKFISTTLISNMYRYTLLEKT